MFFLKNINRIISRIPISPRFIRFGIVGTSGVIVSFLFLTLFEFILPSSLGVWEHRLALAFSIIVAIFSNFLLNSGWTWGDREKTGSWLARLIRFYLVSSVAAFVQWGIAVICFELVFPDLGLIEFLGRFSLYVAQATGVIMAMMINFTANHFWTFTK